MTITTIIEALPPSPARSDTQEVFSNKTDAFLGALPQRVTQMNAVAAEINDTAAGIQSAADALNAFPAQTGNVGKTLKTNGTVLLWSDSGEIGDVSFSPRVFDAAKWVKCDGGYVSQAGWPKLYAHLNNLSAGAYRTDDCFSYIATDSSGGFVGIDTDGTSAYVTLGNSRVVKVDSSGGTTYSSYTVAASAKSAMNSSYIVVVKDGNLVSRITLATFTSSLLSLGTFAAGETVKDMAFINGRFLILTTSGKIYSSSDDGSSWTMTRSDLSGAAKMKKAKDPAFGTETIFVLRNNVVHFTQDGITWYSATLTDHVTLTDVTYMGAGSLRGFVFSSAAGFLTFATISSGTLTVIAARVAVLGAPTNIDASAYDDIFVSTSQHGVYRLAPDGTMSPIYLGAGNAKSGTVHKAITGVVSAGMGAFTYFITSDGIYKNPTLTSGSTFRLPNIDNPAHRGGKAYIRGEV